MKKIFVLLIGLSLVGAFFATPAFAANKTSRFRGSTRYYQNMENYSKTTKQARVPRYSSRRRVTSINWNVIKQKNTVAKQTPSRRSSTRYRGTSSGTTAVVQSRRSEKDEFQSFKAQNIDFKISLPDGFSVVSDTLNWDRGELVFQKGSTRIKLFATKDRCTAGITYCLKAKSDEALEAFQETLPEMSLRQNKNVRLDSNQAQLKKNNMGRLVDLYARDYGAAQLTFFDPINEFVWVLRVIDPNHSTGLVKNNKDLYKIFASLTQKTYISSKTSRTSLSNLFGTRNRSAGRTTRNKTNFVLGNTFVEKFVAENVPFHIELSKGFELVSDTIERSTGEMRFEKDMEVITITATEALCDDQTPRLIRRCLDEKADVLKKEMQREFPSARILQNSNMQVQLIESSGLDYNARQSSTFKDHIGKIVIFRDAGKRMGYFVFAEPETGFVWNIRMEAPEDKDAFLNDVRQKTKILNSLFFTAE